MPQVTAVDDRFGTHRMGGSGTLVMTTALMRDSAVVRHFSPSTLRACYRAKINVDGDGVGWNETSSKPASASQAR
jgi:hypothetical protein